MSDLFRESSLIASWGKVDLRQAVGQNEIRPIGRPRTTATGYLQSRRPWNKVSGRDIIAKSQHPVSTAKEVRLYAKMLHRACSVTTAGRCQYRTDCGMANPQVA